MLFINFKGLKGEALLKAISETEAFFAATPPDINEFLPVISDVTGSVIDSKAMDKFKTMTKNIKGYKHKSAVIGLTAAKRVLLNAINFVMGQESKVFEDERAAVEWLFSSK